MNNNFFWLSPEEYTWGVYQPQTNRHRVVVQSTHEVIPKANWFPGILHAIPVGNMNLFELVAGSEEGLEPNQLELKNWIQEQSHKKHEPLRFPVLIDVNENLSKEELAGKIINHIKNGSDDMIFLPTLPVNPHIKQDHKKEPSALFKLHEVPRIFPTALA